MKKIRIKRKQHIFTTIKIEKNKTKKDKNKTKQKNVKHTTLTPWKRQPAISNTNVSGATHC